MTYLIVNKIFQKKKKIEKILSANATVSGIINNILYAIMHLEKFQILNKSKYINLFFFFFGKISCKTFNYENKSILSRLENDNVLKKFQD